MAYAGHFQSGHRDEVPPEMRAARPGADDVRDVVVPAQQAVLLEVERLPSAMGVELRGQLHLHAGQRPSFISRATAPERLALREREGKPVIVGQRIAEEIERVGG